MRVFKCEADGGRRAGHGACRFSPGVPAVAGLLGLLVIAAATGRAQGTGEAEPSRETIVYSSIQPANWDLYLFDGPGSEPRRLTTDPGLDYNGVVSPDGRWVVFTSERTGSPDLYVLDLHGDAGPRPLVEGPAMEDAAAISPDGGASFRRTRDGNAESSRCRSGPRTRPRRRRAEPDPQRCGRLQPGVLARRHTHSLLQQPRHGGGDELGGEPRADLPRQRAVRDAGGRDRRTAAHPARELGRRPGVDAGRGGRLLLLAAGRRAAHLPNRRRPNRWR